MRTCVTPDGTSIRYTCVPGRSADSPRLALVHSLALDHTVWDGVVECLAGEVAVLSYDCRGHGMSGRHRGPYTAALFAADLSALFDAVGWTRAVVAGCSMGGNVAQAFAAAYPARVAALGLIDTTAWYGPDGPVKFRERAEAARAQGMEALVGFQLTRWVSDEFRLTHPDVLARLTEIFVANDLECYAASCGLLGLADSREAVREFRWPVSVVVGEEDYATPVSMARALHEAIPHASLTILERARHLTPIECPDRIAAELRTLVARAIA